MCTIENSYTDFTPTEIFKLICNEQERFSKARTYIIMGQPGPTGKTRLCEELRKKGFTAFEISEHFYDLVNYRTDKNHYRICGDVAVIVLNRTLPQYVKGE